MLIHINSQLFQGFRQIKVFLETSTSYVPVASYCLCKQEDQENIGCSCGHEQDLPVMVAMNLSISQKHPQTPNATTVYRTFLKLLVKNLQPSMVKVRDNSEDSTDGT